MYVVFGDPPHYQRSTASSILLIASLVLAAIEYLSLRSSSLCSLKLLRELSSFLEDRIVLGRILPYAMSFISDSNAQVRAEALTTSTSMVKSDAEPKRGSDSPQLMSLEGLSQDDSSIFTEWIIPTMRKVFSDDSVYVRSTYAYVIGYMGIISHRAKFRRVLNYRSRGYVEATRDVLCWKHCTRTTWDKEPSC